MKNVKYLIIGNGIAGLSAVKQIRKKDEDGSICMVSGESRHTYYRIKLTELISKEFSDDEILVNKEEWYKDNNIDVLLNTKVDKIFTDDKKIKLDNDDEIEFEKLLIATGSNAFIPPIKGNEKEGVFALRTVDDLNEFKSFIDKHENVAVIGGGLLGLEAAWAVKELGKKVSIIEFNDGLLNRQLDSELSNKLAEELKSEGFDIHLGVSADEILGDKEVEGLKLSNGETLNLGAVLISSGVRSDLDLVRDTDLEVDRGLKVNNKLETSISDIYAAGDVAEVDGITLGLWTSAMEMGRIAGDNMVDGESEYNLPKLFASMKIGPINLFSAGQITNVDKVYESKDEESINKLFVIDDKIVGGILYGKTKLMNKFRTAVFNKENIDDFLVKNELEDAFK